MISTLIFDFSRVILFPKDKEYIGGLNPRHDQLSQSSDYRFLDHFELNEELLQTLEEVKNKYALYIFTTGHVQNESEVQERIKGIFQRVISVEDIPFSKKDPRGYLHVLEEFNAKPGEVLYVDDTMGNIEVAQKAGLDTIHFENNEQLFRDLKTRGII